MTELATRPTPGAGASSSRGGSADRQRRRLLWPFVAPALLVYGALLLAPLVYSAYLSLTKWRGLDQPQFRGFDNYVQLLSDDAFRTSFRNTLIITIGVGIVTFAASFAVTMVLREMVAKRFIRAALFFPNIVAPVVLSILWGFLFRSDGLVNSALAGIGIDGPNWLGESSIFAMVCLALVWINTGFYTTIFMAAVDNIPPYFYEDAELAGANAFQRFRYVTLPLSWDVISVAALLWTITSVKIFEFIYALAGASGYLPPPATWNSALFVYSQTFGGRTAVYQFGYASAAAIATLIPIALLVVLLRRIMRRERLEF